jgi:hypothetical protein
MFGACMGLSVHVWFDQAWLMYGGIELNWPLAARRACVWCCMHSLTRCCTLVL